jgi:hypothetical protein
MPSRHGCRPQRRPRALARPQQPLTRPPALRRATPPAAPSRSRRPRAPACSALRAPSSRWRAAAAGAPWWCAASSRASASRCPSCCTPRCSRRSRSCAAAKSAGAGQGRHGPRAGGLGAARRAFVATGWPAAAWAEPGCAGAISAARTPPHALSTPSSSPPTRRAKLYYLRELTGKSARLKEIFVTREGRAKAAAAAAAKAEKAAAAAQ